MAAPLIRVVGLGVKTQALGIDPTVWCFTSINGISFFKQQLDMQLAIQLEGKDVWVMGLESQKEMERWGVQAHLPQKQHGPGMAKALVSHYHSRQKIALIQGTEADPSLKLALEKAGHEVTRMDVYRTKAVKTLSPLIKKKIAKGALVHLASPSAVTALTKIMGLATLKTCQLMAIGPTTAQKISSYCLEPVMTLSSPDYQSTLEAIEKYFVTTQPFNRRGSQRFAETAEERK